MKIKLNTEAWNLKNDKIDIDTVKKFEYYFMRYQGNKIPWFVSIKPSIEDMFALVSKYKKCANLILIGEGGAINNTIAFYEAFKDQTKKKLFVVDGSDPTEIIGNLGKFSKKDTLVIVISKSGSTLNVILEYLMVAKKFNGICITSENSELHKRCLEFGYDFYPHPSVGGRFTGNHANTLIPLLLLFGENKIKNIIDGFNKAYADFDCKIRMKENLAKQVAVELDSAEKNNFIEAYVPVYCSALTGFFELLIQLNHETYCKNAKGISFLVFKAPECHHHTNQRFLGGKNNIFGIGIRVENYENDRQIYGKLKMSELLDLELKGLQEESIRKKIPFMIISIEKLDFFNLAYFIGFWQYVVVYSAYLRGVNAFDQPAVENSKNKTRELADKYYKTGLKKDFF